jgi:hypothetical protein
MTTAPIARIARLDTAAGLCRELGRLYCVARRNAGGKISPSDALRLSGILNSIRSALELETIEARLRVLEDQLRGGRKS